LKLEKPEVVVLGLDTMVMDNSEAKTAVLFTNRPLMFWGILPLVALSIGVYEYVAGTQRALVLYWMTDLGGSLGSTLVLVLPLYITGTALGETLAYADDVGMSGGGFGCVGAWVHRLSPGMRPKVLVGVLVYLLVRLVFFTDLYADVLHLFTFTGGFWLDRMLIPRGG
jgi:hypothetical protein